MPQLALGMKAGAAASLGQTDRMSQLIEQVRQALSKHQPELHVSTDGNDIVVDGVFVISSPEGPFDSYNIRMTLTEEFPLEEPRVFETGNRLPRIIDRHVFPSGACCLGIWEEWLVTSDRKFDTFLTGVLHDYFVSQTYFESRGEWPFGERSHGDKGVYESYSEVLGTPDDENIVCDYLKILSQSVIKGHSRCPCGSGERLRKCHINSIFELRSKVPVDLAKRMLNRVRPMKATRKLVR